MKIGGVRADTVEADDLRFDYAFESVFGMVAGFM